MRSLWSTAAQQWGCHCRACIRTTSNAIGRRATATTTRRRKAGLGEIFVRCYSAFMATAAVTDAFYKDRRRYKLDNEIAEAKAKLTKLMETTQSSDLARLYESSDKHNDHFLDYPTEKGDPLHSFAQVPGSRLYFEAYHSKKGGVRWLSPEQKELFPPHWHHAYSPRLDSLGICRRALDNEGKTTAIEDREPRTDIQWQNMEDRLNNLVDDLMRTSYRINEAEAFNQNTGPGSPQSWHEMIRRLRAEGYPSYQHPSGDRMKAHQVRARLAELNQSNMTALAAWNLESQSPQRFRRDQYVARICYNLLVSEVPPGISNYNHLMLGFMELGEYELASVVADSFLSGSRLKPTRGTILCLLQLARLNGGAWRLQNLARRMLGYDERGLLLGRRELDLIKTHNKVARWATHNQVVATGSWAVELPKIDFEYYVIFLEAFLDFDLLRKAMDVFFFCIRGGFAPKGEVVRRLFHACVASADSSVIRHAVAGMLQNVEALTDLLYKRRFQVYNYDIARHIRRLLALRSGDHISKIFDRDEKCPTETGADNSTTSDFDAFLEAFGGEDEKRLAKTAEYSSNSNNHNGLCAINQPSRYPPGGSDALRRLVTATWIMYLEGQLQDIMEAVRDARRTLLNWNVLPRGYGNHRVKYTVVKRNQPARTALALKLVSDAAKLPSSYAAEIEEWRILSTVMWVRKVLKERMKRIYILDRRVRKVTQGIGQRRGELDRFEVRVPRPSRPGTYQPALQPRNKKRVITKAVPRRGRQRPISQKKEQEDRSAGTATTTLELETGEDWMYIAQQPQPKTTKGKENRRSNSTTMDTPFVLDADMFEEMMCTIEEKRA